MKRTILFIALSALLMAGCHQKANEEKTFNIHNCNGEKCYQLTFSEEQGPWGNTVEMVVSYMVAWPDEGCLPPAAERELQYFYFGDSTNTFEVAAKGWLEKTFFYDNEEEYEKAPIDQVDDESDFCYVTLESECARDSQLVTFLALRESLIAGAAHGMHSADYLTFDLETGRSVHLADLVSDTTLLCEAIAHAIQDLEVNKGMRDCLFDEFRDVERMPMPHNFTIDSERNFITVYYALYEIAPYACGIQEVILPIFWLSKHVALTPYAKRLFGPESSL